MKQNLLKMNLHMIIILLTSLISFTNCRPCLNNTRTKLTCPPGWKPFDNGREGCYYLPPPVTRAPTITITRPPPLTSFKSTNLLNTFFTTYNSNN